MRQRQTLLLCALLVSSCHQSGTLEGSFTSALVDHYRDSDETCIASNIKSLVEYKSSDELTREGTGLINVDIALIKIGVLSKNNMLNYTSPDKAEKKEAIYIFRVTDKGKRLFIKDRGFCLRLKPIIVIITYTEPAPKNGMIVSYVTFGLTYATPKDPLVRQILAEDAIKKMMPNLIDYSRATRTVVHTNHGWIDASDLSRIQMATHD